MLSDFSLADSKTAPIQENLPERSFAPSRGGGGALVSPVGSHNFVGAVSIGQAMLVANWPFLGKSRTGRSAPCRPSFLAFLFFFTDLF